MFRFQIIDRPEHGRCKLSRDLSSIWFFPLYLGVRPGRWSTLGLTYAVKDSKRGFESSVFVVVEVPQAMCPRSPELLKKAIA